MDSRCEVPLDCTDTKVIQSLVDAATEYIEASGDAFDRICDVLMDAGEEDDPSDSAVWHRHGWPCVFSWRRVKRGAVCDACRRQKVSTSRHGRTV